jgi:hypothetical protein
MVGRETLATDFSGGTSALLCFKGTDFGSQLFRASNLPFDRWHLIPDRISCTSNDYPAIARGDWKKVTCCLSMECQLSSFESHGFGCVRHFQS